MFREPKFLSLQEKILELSSLCHFVDIELYFLKGMAAIPNARYCILVICHFREKYIRENTLVSGILKLTFLTIAYATRILKSSCHTSLYGGC